MSECVVDCSLKSALSLGNDSTRLGLLISLIISNYRIWVTRQFIRPRILEGSDASSSGKGRSTKSSTTPEPQEVISCWTQLGAAGTIRKAIERLTEKMHLARPVSLVAKTLICCRRSAKHWVDIVGGFSAAHLSKPGNHQHHYLLSRN